MSGAVFQLLLVLTAGIISLLTGRNRRQTSRIPQGMAILCQPPGKRYLLYALGVLTMVFVLGFFVLYLLDGAPEEARGAWSLCVALAVGILLLTTLGGNMLARECVYFDREKVQIEKPFRKTQTVRWKEIGRIEGSFDRLIRLYRTDGTRVLSADCGMVNYERFCRVLKQSCPGGAAGYYRERAYDEPEKCVLRCGTEYYLLAGMGLLLNVPYAAILWSVGSGEFLARLLAGGPSEWFALCFAPVCGAVSLAGLFVFCRTRIVYSQETLVLQTPLRRRQELYWRKLRRVELSPECYAGQGGWKTLRLCTDEDVRTVSLRYLTHGRDGFLTALFRKCERYGIPCTGVIRER